MSDGDGARGTKHVGLDACSEWSAEHVIQWNRDMHAHRSTELAAKLNDALEGGVICTGTSAAAAMLDLADVDIAGSALEDAFAPWLRLSRPAIRTLKSDLDRLISGGYHVKVGLPAGTLATGHSYGQFRVGSATLGIDVDRPGLHPLNELPENPRGKNLDRLLGYLDQMTLGLSCRAIGLPSVIVVHDRMPTHVLQWAPFAPAAGVVLQHEVHGSDGAKFCSLPDDKLRECAEHIVREMNTLWIKHVAIGARVRAARAAGQAIAEDIQGVRFRAVAIDLSNQLFDETYDVLLNFDAWDDALRPAILYDLINNDVLPKDHFGFHPPASKAAIDDLHALGADGQIDAIAIAVASAAPGGLLATLSRLASLHEIHFPVHHPILSISGSLFWRNGKIRARLDCDRFSLYDGHITYYRQRLSQTLQVACIGRKLTDVAELPFAFDGTVTGVEVDAEGTTFNILDDPWLVDCPAGRVWR